jgi:uncharacterized DUF497 family protein
MRKKYYNWNHDKNELLKNDRNISFEVILFQIENGKLLDVIENPNREKYDKQRIFIVEFDNDAFLVPFIETENEIFLKTIIPSRKATRKYIRGGEDD